MLPILCLLSTLGSVTGTDCFHGDGLDYTGNISSTISGRTCQAWNIDVPHDIEGTPTFHDNFCRNFETPHRPAPWCYTTDPQYRWECCAIPRCPGQPAQFCPIWCCPSDFPPGLQLTLLLVPPFGVCLLVFAIFFVCTLRSHLVKAASQDEGGRRRNAWPDRPRFRSTSGALALFGLFLFLVSGMPTLLYARGMWEPRTSSAFIPLQAIGLLFSLLLVRPSDRSLRSLQRLCASVGFVCLVLGGSAAFLALAHDVCVFRSTTLSYWNMGCVVYSTVGLVFSASFGCVALVYIKFRDGSFRTTRKRMPPTSSTGAEGLPPPAASPAGAAQSAVPAAAAAVIANNARLVTAEVEMHLALLLIWRIVRVDLFIGGVLLLVSGAGRLSWILGVNGYAPNIISGEGELGCGAVYMILAATLTPKLRARLQLGLLPLISVKAWPVKVRPPWDNLSRFRDKEHRFDDIELEHELGAGGFSRVFASHMGAEPVAVKVLKPLEYRSNGDLLSLEKELEGASFPSPSLETPFIWIATPHPTLYRRSLVDPRMHRSPTDGPPRELGASFRNHARQSRRERPPCDHPRADGGRFVA